MILQWKLRKHTQLGRRTILLIHVDSKKFKAKPTGREIGGIKARLAKPESIRDLTIRQVAKALTSGHTIQPGVTPFSEESKAAGRKGTCKEDFTEQTLFMIDIDNKANDPMETPAHVTEVLAAHNLCAAFMYPTFSSTEEVPRFRFALVSDAPFTDKEERDRVQNGLITLFPQADADCINADRIYFGTDKGMIDTDYDAVCAKASLLAIMPPQMYTSIMPPQVQKHGSTIPIGQRHNVLLNSANSLVKKYGICEQAYEGYLERAAQCEDPMAKEEVERIWRDACAFYERSIATAPDYIPPDAYATLKPTDYTDLGEARVFISAYRDKSRYSAATKWLVYDGKKWNESELKAQGQAQQLTDRQLEEARNMLLQAQEEEELALETEDDNKAKRARAKAQEAKAYRKFVLERRKSSRIAATLTEARPDLEIDVQELDADPFLLNTPSGTVDLRTGDLHPHDANNFCTKMTAVSPSTDGAELWKDFMNRITCGDESLQSYHQICSGMELVGKVFCENLIIAHGSGGNGKSTFYNAKFLVMGDYAGSLSAETLTVNCRKNKSPEYAELRGKRFVIAAELEEGMRLDTAVVKKLCSVDPIKAEKKFKDPFEFLPSHTTVLYTNHLPKVGTNDKGTWDRLVVVPFLAKLRGEEGEIKNYADYLFHACGGAILSWMIEGAKRFIAANYIIEQPQIVKDAIERYRQENDWLNNFIAECCEVGEGYTERAGDLFDAYRTYCSNLNEYVRHISDFKAAMVAGGYNWRRDKTGAHYSGLHLKREFAPIVPV